MLSASSASMHKVRHSLSTESRRRRSSGSVSKPDQSPVSTWTLQRRIGLRLSIAFGVEMLSRQLRGTENHSVIHHTSISPSKLSEEW